jgi:hypothetical protein
MDMAEKMSTVKGRKGEAKAGDMVTVKYREKDGKRMISSVTRGKARKMKTTTTKTKTETTK